MGQTGAGSVSSIDSLAHVISSVSPISVGAASSIYNIPVLVSQQLYNLNTKILHSNTNIWRKSTTPDSVLTPALTVSPITSVGSSLLRSCDKGVNSYSLIPLTNLCSLKAYRNLEPGLDRKSVLEVKQTSSNKKGWGLFTGMSVVYYQNSIMLRFGLNKQMLISLFLKLGCLILLRMKTLQLMALMFSGLTRKVSQKETGFKFLWKNAFLSLLSSLYLGLKA